MLRQEIFLLRIWHRKEYYDLGKQILIAASNYRTDDLAKFLFL